MTENIPRTEQGPSSELGRQVSEIFERRATHGDRRLIIETYREKFNKLAQTMPKEQQNTFGIKLEKFFVNINAYVEEYGSRFVDFVRNAFVWPMVHATKDFPRDKYYQISLARSRAWGDFALNSTKTATAERSAYRDHFLPSVFTGSLWGATLVGVTEGVKYGTLVGGLQGAAIGAVAGGIGMGAISLGLRLKDRIMGPPAPYYGLYANSAVVAAGEVFNAVIPKK